MARIDPNGQALINLFPLPYFFDRSVSNGNYNYVFTTDTVLLCARHVKSRYVLNDRNSLVFGYNGFYQESTGTPALVRGSNNWPQWRYTAGARTQGVDHPLHPSAGSSNVGEVHVGWLHHPGCTSMTRNGAHEQRSEAGFEAGQFYLRSTVNLIPDATFGVFLRCHPQQGW